MTSALVPLDAAAAAADACLMGGGTMGARCRAHDWAKTPLGPPERWPQSLKTAVSICLNSQFALVTLWGPDLVFIYNDAYIPALGEKHPEALGRAGREIWPEIWSTIGTMMNQVLATGEATWSADLQLLLQRHGYPEECYFTFSYSGIRAETGVVGGVFTAVLETTDKVLRERRLRTLSALATAARTPQDRRAALTAAASVLQSNRHDLPFTALYDLPRQGSQALRVAGGGPDALPGLLPAAVALAAAAEPAAPAAAPWPTTFAEAARSGLPVLVALPALPPPQHGPWQQPCRQALVLPLLQAGDQDALGFVVVGLNPHRALDEAYRGFCEQVGRELADSIANADAHARERARAEALAEVDRAKTLFFTNVSHEFRTPLTLILEPLAQLGGQPLDDAQRELVAVAQRAANRLLRLVNALLSFARAEAGRARARFQPTELGAFTCDIASAFRSAVERAGLRFEVDGPPLPAPVFVDRDMWEQVVLNLLSNAFKFTLSGTIGVRLAAGADRVELQVRDTGVGIPAAEQPRIFERFHRAEHGQGRSIEGSGIGLSLVRELVQLHGGTIGFESTPGAGSLFFVRLRWGSAHLDPAQLDLQPSDAPATPRGALPFVDEALRWLPTPAPPPGMAQAAVGPSPAATVLVADDNADMRQAFVRALAPRFRVRLAANGQQALQALRDGPADVLVSDVMMPGLDGFALLAAVRADAALQALPVILVSGRAGDEARETGLAARADDYLVKPFRAGELVARIEQQLAIIALRREVGEREHRLQQQAERLAAAERLRESEDRFRQLTALSADWYWEQDAEGRLSYLSPGCAPMAGPQPEAVLGRAPWALDGVLAADGDWAGVRADLQARRGFRDRLFVRRPAGGVAVWYTLSGEPFSGSDGCFRGYRGVGSDVSARMRAGEALREQEAILRIIFEQAPGGIALCAPDGRFLRSNRALQRLLGFSAEALQQRSVREVTDPRDWPDNARLRDELLGGGRDAFVLVKRMRRQDGSVLWARNTVAAVRDESGAVVHTIAQLEDIGEQVQAQRLADRSASHFQALAELSLLTLREEDLGAMLDAASACVAGVLGLPLVGVFLLDAADGPDAGGAGPLLRSGRGWPAGQVGRLRLPPDGSDPVSLGLRAGAAAAAADARAAPLTTVVEDFEAGAAGAPGALAPELRALGLRSGVSALLPGPQGFFGAVAAFATEARACEAAELRFLQSVAYIVAAAAARAQVLAELRDSRALLARAQEIAGLGWWDYDPAADRVRWSAEVDGFLGRPPDGPPVGLRRAIDLVDEADRERLLGAVLGSLAGGHRFSLECGVTRADGSRRELLVIGEPQPDAAGAVRRLTGSAMDVTEARVATERARQSADQLLAMTRRLVRVQEAERRRLASELHDRVGQNLTALAINLEIVRSLEDGRPDGLDAERRVRLQDSLGLVDATSAAISDVMAELRPPMLDDYGLGAALKWMGDLFGRRTGIEVRVRGVLEARASAQRERDLALFRIAQEAFNNIAKHSGAASVDLLLDESAHTLLLSIQDDGVGFDDHAQPGHPSLGMRTMRERAAAVGGALQVQAAAGHGTRIVVRVPL